MTTKRGPNDALGNLAANSAPYRRRLGTVSFPLGGCDHCDRARRPACDDSLRPRALHRRVPRDVPPPGVLRDHVNSAGAAAANPKWRSKSHCAELERQRCPGRYSPSSAAPHCRFASVARSLLDSRRHPLLSPASDELGPDATLAPDRRLRCSGLLAGSPGSAGAPPPALASGWPAGILPG